MHRQVKFYVLVTIVSFFLIVETREDMLVFLKKSASFVLFVFPSLFSFRFPGYQRDDRVLIRHS